MYVIAVVNLKGGSAKTTSSAFLAHAFHSQGKRTIGVDADPQGQLEWWSTQAEWAIPTFPLPAKNLHTRLSGIVSPDTDVVVIDTPPIEEQFGIVVSALRAADAAIITMAPTMAEFQRLPDVWATIDEVDALRATPLRAGVLLNRSKPNTVSRRTYREVIEGDGRHVFSTEIRSLELFAQALGAPVTELSDYRPLADELNEWIG